jgi:hypothetical protein
MMARLVFLAATVCLLAANVIPVTAAETQVALPAAQLLAQSAMYIRTSPLVIDYAHPGQPANVPAGAAASASAAPRQYQFTVPVTVIPPLLTPAVALHQAERTSRLPVTVTCAVGPPSLALAAGRAVNASSSESATVQLQRSSTAFTADVPVTVTAPAAKKPVNAYVCWSVVNTNDLISATTTPANFAIGKITNATTNAAAAGSTSTTDDFTSNDQ